MPNKRLLVNLERKHAMQVTRVSLNNKKLVYVILAQKKLRYPWGRSRITYIGTTKRGMARFAQSAAAKAEEVLSLYGVREMEVRNYPVMFSAFSSEKSVFTQRCGS